MSFPWWIDMDWPACFSELAICSSSSTLAPDETRGWNAARKGTAHPGRLLSYKEEWSWQQILVILLCPRIYFESRLKNIQHKVDQFLYVLEWNEVPMFWLFIWCYVKSVIGFWWCVLFFCRVVTRTVSAWCCLPCHCSFDKGSNCSKRRYDLMSANKDSAMLFPVMWQGKELASLSHNDIVQDGAFLTVCSPMVVPRAELNSTLFTNLDPHHNNS